MKQKLQKCLCFSKDLTLATRLIAFIGIAVSVLLITVLLNDLSAKKFNISRNVALALGLDWRHIDYRANASPKSDPEGAIWEKFWLAIPWLICELLGCISKFSALIFHLITEKDNLSRLFLIGSTIYILVMIWWWLVVFTAQKTWQEKKHPNSEISFSINETGTGFNSILLNSPEPYHANRLYTTI
ncbi:uncharacterized protein LOC123010194 [Tribolium madens]|uniref:uncharacterized protein LOC123010194 n=1 Tax=Tribolium madens TaxID=41895 RepID=UPI001CF73EA0|nr:uncharacterized protein LOC123010194 [Tribolium madens]